MKKKTVEYLSYVLHIATFIIYFVLLFTWDAPPSLGFLNYFGFIFFGLGIVFLTLSLAGQRSRMEGQIVDRGVYGIVRHPMYLGGILLFIAMACFMPVWFMIVLAGINVVVVYRFVLLEDRTNLVTFGEAYKDYKTRVPQVNFITGFFRWLKRSKDRR
jgi:protein-S-isoprenylcysteine O-methyltransferase Ste14